MEETRQATVFGTVAWVSADRMGRLHVQFDLLAREAFRQATGGAENEDAEGFHNEVSLVGLPEVAIEGDGERHHE